MDTDSSLTASNSFPVQLRRVALPLIIQQALTSLLGFIDVLMVGQLGARAIAGVGLGNNIAFVYSVIMFGVVGGISIFTAQFWGKKDNKRIQAVFSTGLISAELTAALFFTAIFLWGEPLMGFYSTDAPLKKTAADYLRLVSFSFFIRAAAASYSAAAKSMEKVAFTVKAGFAAVIINTTLNYCLIYGNLGFPEMGAKGAAAATVIARTAELILLLLLGFKDKVNVTIKINALFNLSLFKKMMRVSLPMIGQSFFWAFGSNLYFGIFGQLGASALAGFNIGRSIENAFKFLFLSLGVASQIMIGKQIGKNDEKKAADYAGKLLLISVGGSLIVGGILFIFRGAVVSLFNVDPETRSSALLFVNVLTASLIFKNVNILYNMGVFRAGGDTFFSMILDTGGVWLISLPLGYLGAFVWGLPLFWVVILMNAEELIKALMGTWRFFSGRWIHNLTEET